VDLAPDPAVAARARWRTAEDRLFPTLLTDPAGYQRGLDAVHAVLEGLRQHATGVADLLAAEARSADVVAAACPGNPLPAELVVGVACAMRDRELRAQQETARRAEAVRATRAAGARWAVLDGPATAAELTGLDGPGPGFGAGAAPMGGLPVGGRRLALHLASGTLLEAGVDPWDRDAPFTVTCTPGETHVFTDRAGWLAGIADLETDIEAAAGP
jgi:hypothetical protein